MYYRATYLTLRPLPMLPNMLATVYSCGAFAFSLSSFSESFFGAIILFSVAMRFPRVYYIVHYCQLLRVLLHSYCSSQLLSILFCCSACCYVAFILLLFRVTCLLPRYFDLEILLSLPYCRIPRSVTLQVSYVRFMAFNQSINRFHSHCYRCPIGCGKWSVLAPMLCHR